MGAPQQIAPLGGPADRTSEPRGRRSIGLAGREFVLVGPRISDPRAQVAAVLITVQVLGQSVLGFDLSIAQILISLVTAAVIEVVVDATTEHRIAWPASALLTGNGVALLLRVPGTEHGDWWSTRGLPIFVAAAGVSVLSKYAIRVGGRHLFNPSNFGLVIVFLLFGSQRADPQDLWWGPWSVGLAATIGVILIGGVALARRLHLFVMVGAFWAALAAGVGVVAASGHSMTARWHIDPVSGWEYWRVVVLSPETMIFAFFMVTDPRTAPDGRARRAVYAAGTALLAALLMGRQETEFATKVSLLLALTVASGCRPLLERRWRRTGRPIPVWVGWAGAVGAVVVLAVAISVAATRPGDGGPVEDAVVERPVVAAPTIRISPAVDGVVATFAPSRAEAMGTDLAQNLALVDQALGSGEVAPAEEAAVGDFLADLEERITSGDAAVPGLVLDEVTIVVLREPGNPQALPEFGALVQGTVNEASADPVIPVDGQGRFDLVFRLREAGGHHRIAAILPPNTPMLEADS